MIRGLAQPATGSDRPRLCSHEGTLALVRQPVRQSRATNKKRPRPRVLE